MAWKTTTKRPGIENITPVPHERIIWKWGEEELITPQMWMVYEDAYLFHALNDQEAWKKLLASASDVEFEGSGTQSQFDYYVQSGELHYTDIAIRRVARRMTWTFTGEKIKNIKRNKPFSPGRVPFHHTELIVDPRAEGWWDKDSVEDFYRSNQFLQIKSVPKDQNL